MARDIGMFNQCRVMKKNGHRCAAAEMVNGQYAGLGICYFHICQALMRSMKNRPMVNVVQRGMLRLVERG